MEYDDGLNDEQVDGLQDGSINTCPACGDIISWDTEYRSGQCQGDPILPDTGGIMLAKDALAKARGE